MIAHVVYDGVKYVYLYKYNPEDNTRVMTILDMDNLIEITIDLPFTDIRINSTIFSYQGDLYFMNGNVIDENNNFLSDSNDRFKYIKAENRWEQLPDTAFPLVEHSNNGKISNYFWHNGNLYFSYQYKRTLRINPDLTMNSYPYDLFFEYNNIIFGGDYNYNYSIYDINKPCCDNNIEIVWGNFQYDLFTSYFTLNNEIYFRGNWFAGPNATNKLKKEILNELL